MQQRRGPRLRPSRLVSWLSLLLLLSVSSIGNAVRKEDLWDYYPQRPVGLGWLNHTDHYGPGQLYRASSVIGTTDNQLLIADCFNNRLQVATVHDDKKRRYQVLGGYGTQPGSFMRPYGLASTGQHIFVSDSHNHRIQKLTWPDFTVVAAVGSYGIGAGQLNFPSALAIVDGSLYVTDTRNHRVVVYTLDLVYQFSFGSRGAGPANFSFPEGIAASASKGGSKGGVYVVDSGNDRLQVFTPSGTFVRVIGGSGTAPGLFDYPISVATLGSRLYVSEFGGKRVQVLTPKGELLHVLMMRFGQMGALSGIYVTMRHVYVIDWERNGIHVLLRVRRKVQGAGASDATASVPEPSEADRDTAGSNTGGRAGRSKGGVTRAE